MGNSYHSINSWLDQKQGAANNFLFARGESNNSAFRMGNFVGSLAGDMALGGGIVSVLRRVGSTGNRIANAASNFPSPERAIATPRGFAHQADSALAQEALKKVKSGATVYRQGSIGVQNTADAQFWSLQNPLNTQNFAKKNGHAR